MLRPKRAASQKAKQLEEEKESDDELNLSEESSGDFSSASSDEYVPTKDKHEETFDGTESSEPADSEIEDEQEQSPSPVKQM